MNDEEVSCLMYECCDKDKVAAFHNDFWTITQEELVRFSRLVASHQRDEILTLIKAYGDARYKEWKGDRTSPHYRSTYMEGMSDASDDILSHILKSAAIREQGKE